MSTRADTEVQTYLDRLRRELADLPAAEVEEIVQDVEPQVVAIAAELDAEPAESADSAESPRATLADRLGDPAEYARELRSAMGVPTEPVPRTPRWLARVCLAVVVVTTVTAAVGSYAVARVHSNDPRPALVFLTFALFASGLAIGVYRKVLSEIAALPEVRLAIARLSATEHFLPVLGYLTSLRPAWLLVRAALVALGTLWLMAWFGWLGAGAIMPATIIAAFTVWVGRRAAEDQRWLWISLPLTGWAVGVAVRSLEILPELASGSHYW